MFVVWSGIFHSLHLGMVALGWQGVPQPAFLHRLAHDCEIFDYVVYNWAGLRESRKNV